MTTQPILKHLSSLYDTKPYTEINTCYKFMNSINNICISNKEKGVNKYLFIPFSLFVTLSLASKISFQLFVFQNGRSSDF